MIVCATFGQAGNANVREQDRWEGPGAGLHSAWVAGIALAQSTPALATAALAGELPELPFKGGVLRPLKRRKFGTHWYLAMWQGLRGESLYIDTMSETKLTCQRHGVVVTFTSDRRRWGPQII